MAGPDLLGIPSPHRDSEHGFLSEGADLLASNLEAMEAKFYVAPLRLGADLEASRDEMLGRMQYSNHRGQRFQSIADRHSN